MLGTWHSNKKINKNGPRISRHLNYVYKKSSRSSLLDSDIYGLLSFVGPMVCRTNSVSDTMVSHRCLYVMATMYSHVLASYSMNPEWTLALTGLWLAALPRDVVYSTTPSLNITSCVLIYWVLSVSFTPAPMLLCWRRETARGKSDSDISTHNIWFLCPYGLSQNIVIDIINQAERTKFDRFVDLNVRGA